MDFATAARYATVLSKSYAKEVFALLVNYQAISASEVATRLNLHINTAQDFLESMESLGIVSKEEVLEKKRPYYRYMLIQPRITLDIDLMQVKQKPAPDNLSVRIREHKNVRARFTVARSDKYITSVTIWSGSGRDREERKVKLTTLQGRFLYHLPFPKTEPLSVTEIMQKANIEQEHANEILDLVQFLMAHSVIEMETGENGNKSKSQRVDKSMSR